MYGAKLGLTTPKTRAQGHLTTSSDTWMNFWGSREKQLDNIEMQKLTKISGAKLSLTTPKSREIQFQMFIQVDKLKNNF